MEVGSERERERPERRDQRSVCQFSVGISQDEVMIITRSKHPAGNMKGILSETQYTFSGGYKHQKEIIIYDINSISRHGKT